MIVTQTGVPYGTSMGRVSQGMIGFAAQVCWCVSRRRAPASEGESSPWRAPDSRMSERGAQQPCPEGQAAIPRPLRWRGESSLEAPNGMADLRSLDAR